MRRTMFQWLAMGFEPSRWVRHANSKQVCHRGGTSSQLTSSDL